MSKRQTRRSVSLSALGYKRAETLARRDGSSVSGILELMLERAAADAGIVLDGDAAKAEMLRRKAKQVAKAEEVASGIFTW